MIIQAIKFKRGTRSSYLGHQSEERKNTKHIHSICSKGMYTSKESLGEENNINTNSSIEGKQNLDDRRKKA